MFINYQFKQSMRLKIMERGPKSGRRNVTPHDSVVAENIYPPGVIFVEGDVVPHLDYILFSRFLAAAW